MAFFSALRKSVSLLFREKKQLAFLLLIDFSFFVIFALAHTAIVLQALPDLSAINQLVAQESQKVPQIPVDAENVDLSQLNFSFPVATFQEHYGTVIKYAALYVLVMFIAYNLLFAASWYHVSRMVTGAKKRSLSYLSYLKRFVGMNAIWLLLYVASAYVFVLAASAAMFGQITLISEGAVSGAWGVLALFLTYFGVISHTLLFDRGILQALKQSVVLGVKKILPLGATFVLVAFVYYLIVQLLARLSLVSAALSFALFLLLFVPWVVISKAVFMVAVQEAEKK